MDLEGFLELYEQLNEKQRNKIFDKEQKKLIGSVMGFIKLFTDGRFYNAVVNILAETLYEEFNK